MNFFLLLLAVPAGLFFAFLPLGTAIIAHQLLYGRCHSSLTWGATFIAFLGGIMINSFLFGL